MIGSRAVGARLARHVPPGVERALDAALDKALAVQRPVVLGYLDRVRARRPGASPAEVVELLDRHYLATVVGTGAASGGAAALPGIGTGASLATGAAEIAAFVSASAMYVLALAEVHGVPVADPQLRRALVLSVLLGDAGTAAVEAAARGSAGGKLALTDSALGRTALGGHWGHVLARPGAAELLGGLAGLDGLDRRLAHLFLTRFGVRQGALLAGRALPFGIGAGVGAAGNAALGRAVIATGRRTFGPAPRKFSSRAVRGSRRSRSDGREPAGGRG